MTPKCETLASLSPARCANFKAKAVGAETVARPDIPAMAHFCTNSNEQRDDIKTKP